MITIDKIKAIIQTNSIIILTWLAFSITLLNLSPAFGIMLLIFLIALILAIPYFHEEEEPINLWHIIVEHAEKYEHNRQIEKEKHDQFVKERKQREKEERAKQAKLNEERLQKEKLEREKAFAVKLKQELSDAHEMLKEQGLSESAIAIALEEKRVQLNKEFERHETNLATQQTRPTNHSSTHKQSSQIKQLNQQANMSTFQLKKRGMIMNYFVIGVGVFILFHMAILLAAFFDFSDAVYGSVLLFFLGVFLFTLLFYLPTLLYYSSIPGKLFIFIINTIFGATIIVWILLLLYVIAKNGEYASREELLHHQRNK